MNVIGTVAEAPVARFADSCTVTVTSAPSSVAVYSAASKDTVLWPSSAKVTSVVVWTPPVAETRAFAGVTSPNSNTTLLEVMLGSAMATTVMVWLPCPAGKTN